MTTYNRGTYCLLLLWSAATNVVFAEGDTNQELFDAAATALLNSRSSQEVITELVNQLGDDTINLVSETNKTLLHLAATQHSFCLPTLLEKGANTNATDSAGRTPLHYAAANGEYDAVASLIKTNRENISTPDNYKKTALHYAATYAELDIVELLIEKGAQVETPTNQFGFGTPYDVAYDRATEHSHRWNEKAYFWEITRKLTAAGAKGQMTRYSELALNPYSLVTVGTAGVLTLYFTHKQ